MMKADRPVAEPRTRWYQEVSEELRSHFKDRGFLYPNDMAVEAGFPHPFAEALFGFVGGETIRDVNYNRLALVDDHKTIVRVRVDFPCPLHAAGVLIHELCHAVLPMDEGHGPRFENLCRSFHLIGPATYTSNSSLTEKFLQEAIFSKVSPWPKVSKEWEVSLSLLELYKERSLRNML